MGKFQKGNKASKGQGGARPGAGRPDGQAIKALKFLLQDAKLGQLAEWLRDKAIGAGNLGELSVREKAILTTIIAMDGRDENGVTPTALKAAASVLNFTDKFGKMDVEYRGPQTDEMLIHNGQVKRLHKDFPLDEM